MKPSQFIKLYASNGWFVHKLYPNEVDKHINTMSRTWNKITIDGKKLTTHEWWMNVTRQGNYPWYIWLATESGSPCLSFLLCSPGPFFFFKTLLFRSCLLRTNIKNPMPLEVLIYFPTQKWSLFENHSTFGVSPVNQDFIEPYFLKLVIWKQWVSSPNI